MSAEEKELRQKVIDAAINYYDHQHAPKKEFKPGDRIAYGGRGFYGH